MAVPAPNTIPAEDNMEQYYGWQWELNANCKSEDPEYFFPTSIAEWNDRLPTLRKICGECVVRDMCLRTALAEGRQHGFWGGKSEKERRLMIRKVGLKRLIDYLDSNH